MAIAVRLTVDDIEGHRLDGPDRGGCHADRQKEGEPDDRSALPDRERQLENLRGAVPAAREGRRGPHELAGPSTIGPRDHRRAG